MATQKNKIPELTERIGRALDKLGGKVSDLRRDAVESHLATVASNLEADIADQGEAVKAAEALAADAKKKADEAQRLADEARAAAKGDDVENAGTGAATQVKTKKVLFQELAGAGKEELLAIKADSEAKLQQNADDKSAQTRLEVVIELLKKSK